MTFLRKAKDQLVFSIKCINHINAGSMVDVTSFIVGDAARKYRIAFGICKGKCTKLLESSSAKTHHLCTIYYNHLVSLTVPSSIIAVAHIVSRIIETTRHIFIVAATNNSNTVIIILP